LLTPKLQMLQDTLKRLMRRQAAGSLEKVLNKTHAADLAFLLPHFSSHERKLLFERCANDERRAEILAQADSDVAAQVLENLQRDLAVELLHRMEPDDVSDLMEHLPEELADELLARMRAAERSELEELARYDSATAGGIMSPRFFALHRDTTANGAIEALHRADADVEMAFYVYVVNEVGQLLGVVSLRQLVTSKPDKTLFEIMISDVIRVSPDVDQEEVARLASRYGLLAIPVVNGSNKLLGIVTIDDVIDVLREEATEDILRMAGAGDELVEQKTVLVSAAKRLPWLLATGVGGALGALLIAAYATTLASFNPLIYFVPVVLGLAGVTGLQSSALLSQSIAQGRMDLASLGYAFLRQAASGLLLGVISGGLVALFAWLWLIRGQGGQVMAAVVLGSGIAAAMAAASALGVLLPILLVKARVDPALASGPAVAIAADLVGLFIYLFVAHLYF
jgi:magnesium transporter